MSRKKIRLTPEAETEEKNLDPEQEPEEKESADAAYTPPFDLTGV